VYGLRKMEKKLRDYCRIKKLCEVVKKVTCLLTSPFLENRGEDVQGITR
jgi:hypothetical protein